MDNCSVHHTHEVSDLFRDAGIIQLFLPPYSPDMNPTELAFGYIKAYLRKHEDIVHVVQPEYLVMQALQSITIEQCNSWINHCKY